jgi:hypothetical protein
VTKYKTFFFLINSNRYIYLPELITLGKDRMENKQGCVAHHDEEKTVLDRIEKINAAINRQVEPLEDSACVSRKSDSYQGIIDEIKATIDGKNSEYKADPITVLSVDDLLCQIKIKGVRAQLAVTSEKQKDELLDIIVYSLLTMRKIEHDR